MPSYAVNGYHLILLWKSGTQKIEKCIMNERRKANELFKEMLIQAERSSFYAYVAKFPKKFSLFLEAEVKNDRDQVK
jgi:hypothetical protein